MFKDFTTLSEQAKVWIYPSSRKFYPQEVEEIEAKIKNFVTNWNPKDDRFLCSYQFLYNRFIIISVEESVSSITNEQMDFLVCFIMDLQNTYKVQLLDRMNVCFKQGKYIQYKELKEFKKLLKNKTVSKKTVLFDNLITTKFDFENYWQVSIEDSWYKRFL